MSGDLPVDRTAAPRRPLAEGGSIATVFHPCPHGATTCWNAWSAVPEWDRLVTLPDGFRLVLCNGCGHLGVILPGGFTRFRAALLFPGAEITESEGQLTVTLPAR